MGTWAASRVRGHCAAPVFEVRGGERQGRDTEGQEEGTMGAKAMTLLRDAVTHGT